MTKCPAPQWWFCGLLCGRRSWSTCQHHQLLLCSYVFLFVVNTHSVLVWSNESCFCLSQKARFFFFFLFAARELRKSASRSLHAWSACLFLNVKLGRMRQAVDVWKVAIRTPWSIATIQTSSPIWRRKKFVNSPTVLWQTLSFAPTKQIVEIVLERLFQMVIVGGFKRMPFVLVLATVSWAVVNKRLVLLWNAVIWSLAENAYKHQNVELGRLECVCRVVIWLPMYLATM